MEAWSNALKKYHTENPLEKFSIPKKGSEKYNKVMQLSGLVIKEPVKTPSTDDVTTLVKRTKKMTVSETPSEVNEPITKKKYQRKPKTTSEVTQQE